MAKVLEELTNAPDADLPKELLRMPMRCGYSRGRRKRRWASAVFMAGARLPAAGRWKGAVWRARRCFRSAAAVLGFNWWTVESTFVMLFMTPDSIKYLLRDKVTLGGDVSASGCWTEGRAASARAGLRQYAVRDPDLWAKPAFSPESR